MDGQKDMVGRPLGHDKIPLLVQAIHCNGVTS